MDTEYALLLHRKKYTHTHILSQPETPLSSERGRLLFLVSSTVTGTEMDVKPFYKVAEIQKKIIILMNN